MSRQRRTCTPQEKVEIVLEIIQEKHYLRSQENTKSLNQSSIFDKKGEDIDRLKQDHEAKKEKLVKKIGELIWMSIG